METYPEIAGFSANDAVVAALKLRSTAKDSLSNDLFAYIVSPLVERAVR